MKVADSVKFRPDERTDVNRRPRPPALPMPHVRAPTFMSHTHAGEDEDSLGLPVT
jgi:hypothetical protein